VPPLVEDRLSAAAEALSAGRTELAEDLLWEAHRLAPGALAAHFELYRFYLGLGDAAQAERIARLGLEAAARAGGFAADWRTLEPGLDEGPAFRFSLVALKALAQIRLGLGDVAEAGEMLERLEELDPLDTVGHGAVTALFGWPDG
jgi:tetratricopeptide (TPR) repeat protein